MCHPTAAATTAVNYNRSPLLEPPKPVLSSAIPSFAGISISVEKPTPCTSSSNRGGQECSSLGAAYQLNDNDVICGRGKRSSRNVGNIRFREIALERADAYRNLKTRVLKKQYIEDIIFAVRSAGGHFLQRKANTGEWYELGGEAAAAKVGHALRDAKDASGSKASKKACKGKTSKIISTVGWDQLIDDLAAEMFHPINDDLSDLESVLQVTKEADDLFPLEMSFAYCIP